jgi:hypothetical protein
MQRAIYAQGHNVATHQSLGNRDPMLEVRRRSAGAALIPPGFPNRANQRAMRQCLSRTGKAADAASAKDSVQQDSKAGSLCPRSFEESQDPESAGLNQRIAVAIQASQRKRLTEYACTNCAEPQRKQITTGTRLGRKKGLRKRRSVKSRHRQRVAQLPDPARGYELLTLSPAFDDRGFEPALL